MKFYKFLLIIFISLTTAIKADSNKKLINHLEDGGKLIFIRHAYAPGSGDPSNFNLNDCLTQRNLSENGKKQAQNIGKFFKKNKIKLDKVFSSEWCRCKETASIAFENYEIKSFLNSFFDPKFAKYKDIQIINLKKYINNWESDKNLVLVTHYVMITEVLGYSPSSGEIVVSNKEFEKIGSIKIEF
tara:strand:+ start:71 stop:628 length:558 start_codon:yes stop_codon:yes gene_type:complete